MDLAPCLWLRWPCRSGAGGSWDAELYLPAGEGDQPWRCHQRDALAALSALPLEHLPRLTPQPPSPLGRAAAPRSGGVSPERRATAVPPPGQRY